MDGPRPKPLDRTLWPLARIFVWGTLTLVALAHLTCLCWPVLALVCWGGAYDDGLSGQPMPFPRVLMMMLGLMLGGVTTLINLVLLACVWHRDERKWVLRVLLIAVALGGSAACLVASRDYSSERFADGFHDRVQEMKLDFGAVRAWIATLPTTANTSFNKEISESTWPAELRRLRPDMISVENDRGVRDTIVLYWGGWGDNDPPCWTLTIGPTDLPTPHRTSNPIQSPVHITRMIEPGVYVGPDVNMGTQDW